MINAQGEGKEEDQSKSFPALNGDTHRGIARFVYRTTERRMRTPA